MSNREDLALSYRAVSFQLSAINEINIAVRLLRADSLKLTKRTVILPSSGSKEDLCRRMFRSSFPTRGPNLAR